MSCTKHDAEAHYHWTISAFADLIREHGFCNVMNDVDALIAEEANVKVATCNCDGVPVEFEERN